MIVSIPAPLPLPILNIRLAFARIWDPSEVHFSSSLPKGGVIVIVEADIFCSF